MNNFNRVIRLMNLSDIKDGLYNYRRRKYLDKNSLWYQYYLDQNEIKSCIIIKTNDELFFEDIETCNKINYPFSIEVEMQNVQTFKMDTKFNSYNTDVYRLTGNYKKKL